MTFSCCTPDYGVSHDEEVHRPDKELIKAVIDLPTLHTSIGTYCHMPSDSDIDKAVRRAAAISEHLVLWNTRSNFERRAGPSSVSEIAINKGNMIFPGGCYCTKVRYEIDLEDADQARTSLCHCGNCKKFTGGPFGITTKIPKSSWTVTKGKEYVKVHEADNGSGTLLHREFCSECGSGLLEYGANAKDNIYIFYGTLDTPTDLPPKGEFFCIRRDNWMPEIPGIFHKQKVFE